MNLFFSSIVLYNYGGGKSHRAFLENYHAGGASLQCLHTNAHSTGNKNSELKVCVWLQFCHVVGIMEMWWDSSHKCSSAAEGYRLCRKARYLEASWGSPFCERTPGCMELCLGKGEEPTESLWVRIKEQTTVGDIVVGFCYSPPDQAASRGGLLLTARSSLTFADPAPHGGLQPCLMLMEEQHRRS